MFRINLAFVLVNIDSFFDLLRENNGAVIGSVALKLVMNGCSGEIQEKCCGGKCRGLPFLFRAFLRSTWVFPWELRHCCHSGPLLQSLEGRCACYKDKIQRGASELPCRGCIVRKGIVGKV